VTTTSSWLDASKLSSSVINVDRVQINISLLEFSGWDASLEKDIKLSECSAFWLRNPEESPDEAQEAGATPYKACRYC